MAILGKFELDDTISFETYIEAVVQQSYNHVVAVGIVSAEDCALFGYDVYALHAQVYRYIPQGRMEDNPASYKYLVVKDVDGNKMAVGLPWIKEDTIKVFKTNTVTYTVEGIAQEDINRIRDVIARYGYHVSVNVD
nr:MAG TPA: hypothetical protein [Caudoviricetes sp.]